MITVKQAHPEDVHMLAPLFNAYRVFYGEISNITGSIDFISERLTRKQSVVFIAFSKNQAVGFTQLYPIFSSVSMQSFYVLNDLYVQPDRRNQGVGEALLKQAQQFCIEKKCKGLALETANDNPAQKLYERLGWQKDQQFLHYFWKNPDL